MRLDRLTIKSRDAIASAEALARRFSNQEVSSLHLLQALIDQQDGLVTPLLEKAGANVHQLRENLDAALDVLWRDLVEDRRTGVSAVVQHISEQIEGALAPAQREHPDH